MNLDRYPLEAKPDFLEFEFLSIGPKGRIKKMVQFTAMGTADPSLEIYNLAFGDYNEADNIIDDLVISDNKDPQKILATVAEAVMSFTDKKPAALVFAQGSTAARARYYAMGIAANLNELERIFDIWESIDGMAGSFFNGTDVMRHYWQNEKKNCNLHSLK